MTEEPYLLAHVCKQCGVKARVSKRSMRLYSHHLPGTTSLCPASDRIISEDAEVIREPMQVAPKKPPAPKKKKRRRPKARRSESIWAVSGGLPGLGRRR